MVNISISQAEWFVNNILWVIPLALFIWHWINYGIGILLKRLVSKILRRKTKSKDTPQEKESFNLKKRLKSSSKGVETNNTMLPEVHTPTFPQVPVEKNGYLDLT